MHPSPESKVPSTACQYLLRYGERRCWPVLPLLIAFAALLARQDGVTLLSAGIMIAVLALLSGQLRQLWVVPFRLRWLLLTMLVAGAWGLPGVRLWPALGALSPTWQGAESALHRVAAVGLLAALAAVGLRQRGVAAMAGELTGYLRVLPLSRCFAERAALRLALALRYWTAGLPTTTGDSALHRLRLYYRQPGSLSPLSAADPAPLVVDWVPVLVAPPLVILLRGALRPIFGG